MKLDVRSYIEKQHEILKEKSESLTVQPSLCIISTGNDPASQSYIKNKIATGTKLGINVTCMRVDDNAKPENIIDLIKEMQQEVDGLIVQLPLRKDLEKYQDNIISAIDDKVDVDGFKPSNIAAVFKGNGQYNIPCTAKGIVDYLKTITTLDHKNVTIINRSEIVGKPLALLLLAENATVTVCHSHTECLQQHLHKADIVVTAIGRPEYFNNPGSFKHNAIVIDVSINRGSDGKLCGDCSKVFYDEPGIFVTPVPGGVGPLTVLTLCRNVIENAARRK